MNNQRPIKFRAWNDIRKQMLSWDQVEETLPLRFLNNSRLVPLQYTGIKDKNGVEIYEGDVVSTHSSVWDNDVPNKVWKVTDMQKDYTKLSSDILTHEVIGNIYENPELVK